jgi:serine/threonine protein kinase
LSEPTSITQHPSSCAYDSVTLRAYVACELSDGAAGAVSDHLIGCESCRAEVVRLIDSGVKPFWDSPDYATLDFDHAKHGNTAQFRPLPIDEDKSDLATIAWPRPGFRVRSFVLGRCLGKGGMGAVYEAFDERVGRKVAIKFVDQVDPSDSGHLRAMHEANALAKLSHPDVLSIFDVIVHDGRPMLVMEFLDGITLERWRQGTPVTPRLAARIIQKLANAIDYAHQQRVVHRDLKPANIMLIGESANLARNDAEADLRLKITDFGIARFLGTNAERLTQTGELIGTIDYMSPEQTSRGNQPVGPASDIYSLGAILYSLLTGHPPLVADEPVVALRMIAETEPMPVRMVRPQVPIDLETICMKCLEKSPERRYPSAADLADDLTAFLERRAIKARPLGPAARFLRLCQRNRAITITVTTIFTSLTLLALTGFEWARRERRNAEVQGRLLTAVTNSNRQLREVWRTGLGKMDEAVSAMAVQLFNQGIYLSDTPESQRKAFEVWAELISSYLQREFELNNEWTYFEAEKVGSLLILQSQLKKNVIPQEQMLRYVDRAQSTISRLNQQGLKPPAAQQLSNLFDYFETNPSQMLP